MQGSGGIGGALATGVLAVGLGLAAGGCGDGGGRLDLDPYVALGTVAAEETAKLLGDQGRVLVMVRDTGDATNPSMDAQLKAFRQTLKSRRGLSLTVEKFQLTPMQMLPAGGGIPPDQLLKALASHPNTAAVVLFFGLPQLSENEMRALKASGAKLVVVSSLRPGYRQLMERQVIHLVIAPRLEAPSGGATPRTLRELFDRDYQIIAAADALRQP